MPISIDSEILRARDHVSSFSVITSVVSSHDLEHASGKAFDFIPFSDVDVADPSTLALHERPSMVDLAYELVRMFNIGIIIEPGHFHVSRAFPSLYGRVFIKSSPP